VWSSGDVRTSFDGAMAHEHGRAARKMSCGEAAPSERSEPLRHDVERLFEQLERTCLYPSESQKVISCELVPVGWRLYALVAYTLSRAGERFIWKRSTSNAASSTSARRQVTPVVRDEGR
jgi:hypothetical protein